MSESPTLAAAWFNLHDWAVPTKQQIMALLLMHESEDRKRATARAQGLDSVAQFLFNSIDLKCVQ